MPPPCLADIASTSTGQKARKRASKSQTSLQTKRAKNTDPVQQPPPQVDHPVNQDVSSSSDSWEEESDSDIDLNDVVGQHGASLIVGNGMAYVEPISKPCLMHFLNKFGETNSLTSPYYSLLLALLSSLIQSLLYKTVRPT